MSHSSSRFYISRPSKIPIWRHCEANGKEVNSGQFGAVSSSSTPPLSCSVKQTCPWSPIRSLILKHVYNLNIFHDHDLWEKHTSSCNPGGILPDNPTLQILPKTGQITEMVLLLQDYICVPETMPEWGESFTLKRRKRRERSQRWRRESLCCRLPRKRMMGRVHFIRN